jgi:hypothetical protein
VQRGHRFGNMLVAGLRSVPVGAAFGGLSRFESGHFCIPSTLIAMYGDGHSQKGGLTQMKCKHCESGRVVGVSGKVQRYVLRRVRHRSNGTGTFLPISESAAAITFRSRSAWTAGSCSESFRCLRRTSKQRGTSEPKRFSGNCS